MLQLNLLQAYTCIRLLRASVRDGNAIAEFRSRVAQTGGSFSYSRVMALFI